jgi:hypothetical protein
MPFGSSSFFASPLRQHPHLPLVLAESFFQSLKRELLHGHRWTSKAQTRLELFRAGAGEVEPGAVPCRRTDATAR